MENLAARYDMVFLGLQTFDRRGQSCITVLFKKENREFVFVPGDTVTLGWEQFAVGLNQESRDELEYLFQEWEMEEDRLKPSATCFHRGPRNRSSRAACMFICPPIPKPPRKQASGMANH